MTKKRRPPDILNRIHAVEKRTRKGETVYEYDPDDRPGPIANVELDFRVQEKKIRIDYDAVVTWDPIAPGTCAADIGYYIIQLEPCNSAGVPKEAGRRSRELLIVEDVEDLESEMLKVKFEKVPHPRRWFYRARVCAVDKAMQKGEWSPWTDPQLPLRDSNPLPPYPDGVALDFARNGNREEPRHRCVVTMSEVPSWDVPPTIERQKITMALNGQLNAGANVITLTTAEVNSLPTPQPKERIPLAIRPGGDNREIVSYAGKSGNQLTGVRRGLEGTADIQHPDGATIILTAADSQDAQNDIENYIVQLRRCNVDGAGNFVSWVTHNGKFVQRTKTRDWDKEDDDNDGIVKVTFDNVRKKHWWRARARTKDRFRRRGDWSDWTNPGSPSDVTGPPNIPAPLVMDVDPRRITLLWDAPNDPDDLDADADLRELHPDIAYFQIQVSDRSDFNKSLSNFWRSDRFHKTQTKAFKKSKKQRGPFHARVRPVDGSGNKGNWLSTNRQRRKPGKPLNPRKERRPRAILFKADPPDAWSDGTFDEWDVSEVAYYKLNVYQNGVLDTDRSVPMLMSLRKKVDVPKGSTGWSAKWESVGHEGEGDGETATTGEDSPLPLDVDFTEVTGTIDYTQMGSLGMSRYGTTTQMNASSAKDGDIWINTSFSPTRVYRRVSGSWVYQVGQDIIAGTITAGAVVAGAIDGHTITGAIIIAGTFRTMNTGQYIELTTGSQQHKVRFMSNGTERANISLIGTGGQMSMWAAHSWVVDADSYMTIDTPQFHLMNQSVNAPGLVNNDTAGVNLIPEGAAGGHRPATWIPIYVGGSSPSNATLVYVPAFKTTTGAA